MHLPFFRYILQFVLIFLGIEKNVANVLVDSLMRCSKVQEEQCWQHKLWIFQEFFTASLLQWCS